VYVSLFHFLNLCSLSGEKKRDGWDGIDDDDDHHESRVKVMASMMAWHTRERRREHNTQEVSVSCKEYES